MADTIESFVAKLQTEGVEAGRREAEKIRADAQEQAQQIVRQAEQRAAQIVSDAESEAQSILSRGKTDLDLAARDTVLRLREALSRLVRAVISARAEAKLNDVEFLGSLLHELVLAYASEDCQRRHGMKINVAPEMSKKLTDWAIQEIGRDAMDALRMPIDLKGTLSEAGFEYTVAGGTVEVTLSSVVDSLCEMVAPRLAEVLERVVGAEQQGEQGPKPGPPADGS